MTNTNSELSRLAAERLGNEKQLRGTEAFAAKVIAEVYAEAVQGWIPCSERLPERWATAILYLPDAVEVGYLTSGDMFMLLPLGCLTKDVTHWQPLPQPPEATT